jgi:hypothetical protein
MRQIYRDCNASSHYLEDSLTTTKVKGPLRGKNLVSFQFEIEFQRGKPNDHYEGALLVALHSILKIAILLQCNPYADSISS